MCIIMLMIRCDFWWYHTSLFRLELVMRALTNEDWIQATFPLSFLMDGIFFPTMPASICDECVSVRLCLCFCCCPLCYVIFFPFGNIQLPKWSRSKWLIRMPSNKQGIHFAFLHFIHSLHPSHTHTYSVFHWLCYIEYIEFTHHILKLMFF